MRKNGWFKKRGQKRRDSKNITGCLEVSCDPKSNITSEALVRKFIKKAKKEGIVEEYRDRRYFKSPSEKNREKKRDRERLLEKVKRKEKELFKFTDRDRRGSYRKKKKTEKMTNG
jgi:hypothetical protein